MRSDRIFFYASLVLSHHHSHIPPFYLSFVKKKHIEGVEKKKKKRGEFTEKKRN